MNSNKSSKGIIIIAIVVFLYILGSLNDNKSKYTEADRIIDERARKEGGGYHGTRKGSWAEDQYLKEDGYDPDEYRRTHYGYDW